MNLTSNPPDICMILRAHAEQRYLTAHVLPTLRQLERPGAPSEDQAGAALAYLEVLWLDARQRAAESDAALAELLDAREDCDPILFERAHRFHVAVRRLREALAERVAALTGAVA